MKNEKEEEENKALRRTSKMKPKNKKTKIALAMGQYTGYKLVTDENKDQEVAMWMVIFLILLKMM